MLAAPFVPGFVPRFALGTGAMLKRVRAGVQRFRATLNTASELMGAAGEFVAAALERDMHADDAPDSAYRCKRCCVRGLLLLGL